MNPNTPVMNQLTGLLRIMVPTGVAWAVTRYGLPSEWSGPLTEFVIVLVTALLAAGWDWWTNRAVELAKQVATEPGVTVVVDTTQATPALKELSADPTQPYVVPLVPQ
jgi:hypothetical protein